MKGLVFMQFTEQQIAEKAKELKRAYNRANYAQNKDKRREAQRKHWEKKALEALQLEAKKEP